MTRARLDTLLGYLFLLTLVAAVAVGILAGWRAGALTALAALAIAIIATFIRADWRHHR